MLKNNHTGNGHKKTTYVILFVLAVMFILSSFAIAQTSYITSIARNISIGIANEIFVDVTNSRVGIGTTSPGYKLSVIGEINSSGVNINRTVTGNGALLNVTSDGSTGAWINNTNLLPERRQAAYTVTANGYVYIIGGFNGSARATVYYAKLNADGSVGAWVNQTTNTLPALRNAGGSIATNGYIYVIAGQDDAARYSTVYYSKINSDGSLGPWQTNANALPTILSSHDSAFANGYVYVTGGTDGVYGSSVYYAKLNADGSTGRWVNNTNTLPDTRGLHDSVVANGYIYVIGGFDEVDGAQSTVYYAKLNSNGSVGAWQTSSNSLPEVRYGLGSAVANGYVYALGGYNGTAYRATVYYAKLNADGSVGAWVNQTTNTLPAARYGFFPVVVNGYVYIIGGFDGTDRQSTVYYASTARVLLGASLDLIGLTSANYTPGAGEEGGTVYAGGLYASNKLEVGGNAFIGNGLSIIGPLVTNGSVSLSNHTIYINDTSENVGINTTNPARALHVIGNITISNDTTARSDIYWDSSNGRLVIRGG